MEYRIELFHRRGMPSVEADRMAHRLLVRDRDIDNRRLCIECKHGRAARCPNGNRLPADVLQRCQHFEERGLCMEPRGVCRSRS